MKYSNNFVAFAVKANSEETLERRRIYTDEEFRERLRLDFFKISE